MDYYSLWTSISSCCWFSFRLERSSPWHLDRCPSCLRLRLRLRLLRWQARWWMVDLLLRARLAVEKVESGFLGRYRCWLSCLIGFVVRLRRYSTDNPIQGKYHLGTWTFVLRIYWPILFRCSRQRISLRGHPPVCVRHFTVYR